MRATVTPPASSVADPDGKKGAQANACEKLSARRRDVVFANLILTCFALALLSRSSRLTSASRQIAGSLS